jgi:hypothetical protein
MTPASEGERLGGKGALMNISVIIVMLFVFAVIAIVLSVLFELSPFAHHAETYRDHATGKRLFDSPHLENRDEFDHRTQAR